uniref:Uncharacterized protein n=1 Tax=Anopheles quadriannulatus TaxID=34691 RepID=A0A182XBL4_ANOQN
MRCQQCVPSNIADKARFRVGKASLFAVLLQRPKRIGYLQILVQVALVQLTAQEVAHEQEATLVARRALECRNDGFQRRCQQSVIDGELRRHDDVLRSEMGRYVGELRFAVGVGRSGQRSFRAHLFPAPAKFAQRWCHPPVHIPVPQEASTLPTTALLRDGVTLQVLLEAAIRLQHRIGIGNDLYKLRVVQHRDVVTLDELQAHVAVGVPGQVVILLDVHHRHLGRAHEQYGRLDRPRMVEVGFERDLDAVEQCLRHHAQVRLRVEVLILGQLEQLVDALVESGAGGQQRQHVHVFLREDGVHDAGGQHHLNAVVGVVLRHLVDGQLAQELGRPVDQQYLAAHARLLEDAGQLQRHERAERVPDQKCSVPLNTFSISSGARKRPISSTVVMSIVCVSCVMNVGSDSWAAMLCHALPATPSMPGVNSTHALYFFESFSDCRRSIVCWLLNSSPRLRSSIATPVGVFSLASFSLTFSSAAAAFASVSSCSFMKVSERRSCGVRNSSYSRSSVCLISTAISESMPSSDSVVSIEIDLMSRMLMMFITLSMMFSLPLVRTRFSATTMLATIGSGVVSSGSSSCRHELMRCCSVPPISMSSLSSCMSATRPTSPTAPHWTAFAGSPSAQRRSMMRSITEFAMP